MALMLPRGRTTDIIAATSFAAFLLATITHTGNRLALFAGFIPARVYTLPSEGITVAMPWLPVWLTPLTATLIHSGWLHVGLNLLILVYCGRQIENLIGGVRMLILYLVGAYAGAAAQWLSSPDSMVPMIGASGAISAVIGTYALVYSRSEVKAIGPIPEQMVRILWLAAGWTVLQLMIGLAGIGDQNFGHIAIWAHVGGFIAGLLLARPLLSSRFGNNGRNGRR